MRASLSGKSIPLRLNPIKVETLASKYGATIILKILFLSEKSRKRKLPERNQDLPFPTNVANLVKDELAKDLKRIRILRPPLKTGAVIKKDDREYRIKVCFYKSIAVGRGTKRIYSFKKEEDVILEKIRTIRIAFLQELTDAGFKIRTWPEDNVDPLTGDVITRYRYAVEVLN